MLELQNAQERETADWIKLLQKADSRFKLTGIKRSPESKLALIEVTWQDRYITIEKEKIQVRPLDPVNEGPIQ